MLLPSGQQEARQSFSSSSSSSQQQQQHDPVVVKPYVSGESTHFGYTDVDIKEKEGKVREVFDNVADSYDVMNDFMSAGVHRLWKDYLLQVSAVEDLAKAARSAQVEFKILDVAGGTGDGKCTLCCFER